MNDTTIPQRHQWSKDVHDRALNYLEGDVRDRGLRTPLDTEGINYAETVDVLADVRRKIDWLTAKLDEARTERAQISDTHQAFRHKVREAIINKMRDGDVETSEINDLLGFLGLAPLTTRMTASVEIGEIQTRTTWVEVEFEVDDPDDESEVAQAARDAALAEYEVGGIDFDYGDVIDNEPTDQDGWDVVDTEVQD